jgi:hypothetical protein
MLAAALIALLVHVPLDAERLRIAEEIDDVAAEAPLFAGLNGVARTAALLVAIAFRESGVRLGAIGDSGRSVCAFQILGGARALLTDARACVRAGHALLVQSVRLCPVHPVSIYARGTCSSVDGQRISADRMRVAGWLLREAAR